jgi:hypothetical protein
MATEFLNESFRNSDVTDNTAWLFGKGSSAPTVADPFLTARPTVAPSGAGGLPGGGSDPNGEGVLRLTNNSNNQSSFVIYNKPIPGTNGLSITFDLFAYGGTTGADGISFFLFDAAQTNVTAGAFGGSLGYAQRSGLPGEAAITGIEGGYLGIGFDEFGNYSNGTEGRVNAPGTGGFTPDAIAIRGSESTQYRYLTGTGTLTPGIDNLSATNRNAPGTRRTAKIDITPNGTTAVVSVKIDLNSDGDFLDANEAPASLTNYTIPLENGNLPANFKFGFASSTGSATNFHEVRNLRITDSVPGVTFSGTGITTVGGVPTLTTTEGGAPVTVNAVLGTRPTSNVVLNLVSGDITEGTVSVPSLTFTPANWDVPQAFTINPVDDTLIDGNIPYAITTSLTTTEPVYSAINPADISVTNNDNEPPAPLSPNVTLALTGSPLAENGGVATVTASLSAATTVPVTIGLGFTGTAINGTDYSPSANSITIAPGSTSGTATLTGLGDTLTEGNETAIVDITTVTGGTEATPQQVTATITDNPPAVPNVTLALTGSPLAENGGVATVTATLSTATTVPVTVGLGFTGTAVNGADYIPSANSITIAPGGTFGTATLTGLNDALVEGNESIIVDATTITGGTEATPQQVTATITDGTTPPPNSPPAIFTPTPPEVPAGGTVGVVGLNAIDDDGIGFYTINTVPPPEQGFLFLGDPAQGGTVISAGRTLTPAQIGQVFFRATSGFTGTNFTYSATDNRGATSVQQLVTVAAAAIPPTPDPREGDCAIGTPIRGTNAQNNLRGANGVQDTIFGRGGNDRIRGGSCDDLLDGGNGNDRLTGNSGQDRLRGRVGNDTLIAGAGNDILNGGLGNDLLNGGSGGDLLKGRRGLDLLIGGGGNDTMLGGLSNDRLRGGAGDDILNGGRGDDFVKGGSGNDVLRGRVGRDTLVGFGGDDRIFGGLGADLIVGGLGADILTGNRGRDVFEYRSFEEGGDTITDFEVNRDRIDLRRLSGGVRGLSGGRSVTGFVELTRSGADTIVSVVTGSGGRVNLATLTGVDISSVSLSERNFVV